MTTLQLIELFRKASSARKADQVLFEVPIHAESEKDDKKRFAWQRVTVGDIRQFLRDYDDDQAYQRSQGLLIS